MFGMIALIIVIGGICLKGFRKTDAVEIEDIEYTGQDFIKSCFSVGDSNMYLCAYSTDHSEYYIARMPEDGGELDILPYKIPDNMKVIGMDADSSGECSVLLSTYQDVEIDGQNLYYIDYEITRIDRIGIEGELEYSLEITDEFKDVEDVPLAFESDADGNYFISNGNTLIHFSPDNTVEKIPFDGKLHAVTLNKDKAYAIYMDSTSGNMMLSSIENGEVHPISELENDGDVYRNMSVVGESLYLYSRAGIYRYSNNEQEDIYKMDDKMEERPFIEGEDLTADGDLCMLLKINDKYRIRHIKFASA